ncbi:MAG: sigma-70 family RNA polymerase sigma factor [Planctomycetaceae bacterium]|jgi:DNA-directed RNA polymerase specialized sigma24 family protein|nr:sigma-70 family RNA polymerase sigma factor [Planctomycetaceae bacterium]MBT6486046.1 sigma-70 family RNA polymerase sigma factor [Planctomycetaceae bacterium]
MSSGGPSFHPDRSNAAFATTRWSVVLSAGDRSSPDAASALETLCQVYWYPLYAFARRGGSSPDDSADLTQEFFSRLLEQEFLLAADREKGRFRSFLLTVFKRFLSKERDRAQTQKRGGGRRFLSINVQVGEQRYGFEPSDGWTPEALFERQWALTLLGQVMDKLQSDYEAKGRGALFNLCQPFLTGSGDGPAYPEIALQLEMNETAVRVAVHRLRERYRDMLKHEVAQTITETDSVEDELNYLRLAIRGKNC